VGGGGHGDREGGGKSELCHGIFSVWPERKRAGSREKMTKFPARREDEEPMIA